MIMELLWETNQNDFSKFEERIQLAATLFVIKTTPKDKTPEIHASEVQERLKIMWLTKPSVQHSRGISTALDQLILSQQQDDLSKRLYSIIPQNFHSYLGDSSIPCHSSAEFVQKNSNCPGLIPDNFDNDHCKMQLNANFIQAIIQLKVMAEAHSTIPMDMYVSSVSKLINRKCARKYSREMLVNEWVAEPLSSSEDSGFHAFEDNSNVQRILPSAKYPSPVTGVASSMLLYIVNSGNADQLLTKSTEAVLNQLKVLACEAQMKWSVLNLNEAINAWTGSIYEQAIEALHYITEKQVLYQDITTSSKHYCFTFVQEIIASLRINATHKDICYEKENQIVILRKLCEATNLWSEAIEFIFHNLNELINSTCRKLLNVFKVHGKRQNFHDFTIKLNSIQSMEESFFLLQALKIFLFGASKFLELLCNEKMKHDPHRLTEQRVPTTITELWRKHYAVKIDSSKATLEVSDKMRQVKSDVRRWKYILEESVTQTITDYPSSAVIFFDCIDSLPTF